MGFWLVAPLAALLTFCAPLCAAAWVLEEEAAEPKRGGAGQRQARVRIFAAVGLLHMAAYSVALAFMRSHLFVWSVWAPRWLYAMADGIAGLALVCATAHTAPLDP